MRFANIGTAQKIYSVNSDYSFFDMIPRLYWLVLENSSNTIHFNSIFNQKDFFNPDTSVSFVRYLRSQMGK